MKLRHFLWAFGALSLSACTTVPPDSGEPGFNPAEQQVFVRKASSQYHLDSAYVQTALAQAQYQAKIIALMTRPFEAQSWAVYQTHMLTPNRIAQGKAFSHSHQEVLQQAQQRYHVPQDLIVAILGVETFYGKNQGNYYVLDALSTLSFAYPKRAPFFQSELAHYLQLCQQNHWPVRQLKGSYAGAFGMGQFMPSSYRQYAVSRDGATPNLSQADDAIFSVAHYFAGHGWQAGQAMAMAVNVPSAWQHSQLPKLTHPKHTVAYWRQQGLSVPSTVPGGQPAELVVVQQANGHYQGWLIFANFYVIARYNPSINYALSAFLLSQLINHE